MPLSPENPISGLNRIALEVWERSPDWIITVDRIYHLQYCNPALAQAAGLTQNQLRGRHLSDLLGETEYLTQHQPNLEQCLSGSPMTYESRIFLPVAGSKVMEFRLTPFLGQNLMLEGVVLMARDETKKEQILQGMREKEHWFQHVANHPLLMMYGSDAAGTRNFFNQQWLDFTGCTFDEECQETWLHRVHPNDLLASAHAYQAGIATGQPFTMEYRLKRADGEFRLLQEQGGTLWSPAGGRDGYLGCAIDITDRRLVLL